MGAPHCLACLHPRRRPIIELTPSFWTTFQGEPPAAQRGGQRQRRLKEPLSSKFLTALLAVDPSPYEEASHGRKLLQAGCGLLFCPFVFDQLRPKVFWRAPVDQQDARLAALNLYFFDEGPAV